MKPYEIRPISWVIYPEGEPLYSEMATKISIVDESAGEYVEVEQNGHVDLGKILITRDEWPMLRAAIDTAVDFCLDKDGEQGFSLPDSQAAP